MKSGRSSSLRKDSLMKYLPKLLALVLILSMAALVPSFISMADASDKKENALKRLQEMAEVIGETGYAAFLMEADLDVYEGEDIYLSKEDIYPEARIGELDDQVTLVLEAPVSGLYSLSIDYRSFGDNILPTNLSLRVNGDQAYKELENLMFSDYWASGETFYDRYGNESIAMPVKDTEWHSTQLHDSLFMDSRPLLIPLEKGHNQLVFQINEGKVEFGDVRLEAGYKNQSLPTGEPASGNQYIIIEAEDMTYRNSPNIRTDMEFNTKLTPYDPELKVQNMLAEANFRDPGRWVEYDFDVVEDGYYHLMMRYRQSLKSGFKVYRTIYIDGVKPSQAFDNVEFDNNRKFEDKTLDETIFLEAGSHTLRVQVTVDPLRDGITVINQVASEISDMALAINKMTGGNTDKYRDFELEKYGLDVESNLLTWSEEISQVYELLLDVQGVKKSGEIELLNVAAKTLSQLAENPNQLPQNLTQFSYGQSSVRQNLVSVVQNLTRQSLSLDKITFYQEDAQLPKTMGPVASLKSNWKHFIASFTMPDYDPSYEEDDALTIWLNWPRQYIEIIQRMVDQDFTPETGIKVNLAVVPDQQKLILANASGKAPDGAIGINSTFVYDLALRGALVNLREMEGFNEVGKRFAPGMLIPGVFDEGIYALPETFNFWVMFYRKDMIDQVPDNMDQVREMLPELKRLGQGFNLHVSNLINKPYAATMPFVFQSDAQLFEAGQTQVDLENPNMISGLKYLTENFTIYDMEYEILSFYQGFRDGRLPIGISDYGTYNLLTNAAPELTGLWGIAPYPGLVGEDGQVTRYTSGAAQSALLFSQSDQQEEGFEFLKWWMSADVQTEFAYTLQATLGNEYLWNSANLEAIARSPWSEKDKEIIMEQLMWAQEAPRVPGGYIIERELGNILASVVTEDVNIRTATDLAEKRINQEIMRKLEEFGYTDGEGNQLKPLIIPDIDMIEEWLNEE